MFSVVIPAYNCEATIVRVLDSVYAQTRFDLCDEIIIINDGSTDCTEEVILKYMNNHRKMNIVYKAQENHGVSYTRNRGIRIACSEWIALLDADDLWLPQKIERQYHIIMENTNIVFMGASATVKIFRKKRKGLCKITARELCIRNMPQTPSVVFRKKEALDLGLFNESMRYCEDIYFYQKFLLYDSYYILAEQLTKAGFNKEYFAEHGLSSNLYKMHIGRSQCVKELYKMRLISATYMFIILVFNWFKFFRCFTIANYNKLKYMVLKKWKK